MKKKLTKKQISRRKWYLENKDRAIKSQKEWRENNPEHIKFNNKEYVLKMKKEFKNYQKEVPLIQIRKKRSFKNNPLAYFKKHFGKRKIRSGQLHKEDISLYNELSKRGLLPLAFPYRPRSRIRKKGACSICKRVKEIGCIEKSLCNNCYQKQLYKMLIRCKKCDELRIFHAKGLCKYCYNKLHPVGPMIICRECDTLKFHHAYGLCRPCACRSNREKRKGSEMRPRYYTEEEQHKGHIENALNTLTSKQVKTLRRYIEFYSNKPSLVGGTVKWTSVKNAVIALTYVGRSIKKPYEKMTKQDLIRYFEEQNDKGMALATVSKGKASVLMFYKWIYGVHERGRYPKIVDHPLLKPAPMDWRHRKKIELPTNEDIIKLLNACRNNMEKTIIMFLIEGGFRAGEMVSFNIGSVSFDKKGAKVWVERSKSRLRFTRLIDTSPYLKAWLREHPKKNNPNYPLFPMSEIYNPTGRMKSAGIKRIVTMIKSRVPSLKNKRIYPHLFRHLAVTNRWRDGMRTEINATRHGITVLTLRNCYLHYDDTDVDEEYIKLHNQKQKMKPIIGPKVECIPKKKPYEWRGIF